MRYFSYPLKQVVKPPTRKAAILDKIYTNLWEWYEQPVILPNIVRSDHRAVAMSATFNNKREIGKDVVLVTRSQDPNGIQRQQTTDIGQDSAMPALLAQTLQNFN